MWWCLSKDDCKEPLSNGQDEASIQNSRILKRKYKFSSWRHLYSKLLPTHFNKVQDGVKKSFDVVNHVSATT